MRFRSGIDRPRIGLRLTGVATEGVVAMAAALSLAVEVGGRASVGRHRPGLRSLASRSTIEA